MTAIQLRQSNPLPTIPWEKLPDDFILPDEPVESNLQPLLAFPMESGIFMSAFYKYQKGNEFVAQALRHELASLKKAEIDAAFADMANDDKFLLFTDNCSLFTD